MPEELDYGRDFVSEGLVGGGEVGQDGVHRVFLQDEIFFSLSPHHPCPRRQEEGPQPQPPCQLRQTRQTAGR